MKNLTIRIPDSLYNSLRLKAKKTNQPLSAIVRNALEREMQSNTTDFAKLAGPYKGMFSGPADLSTREGYGSNQSR